jgi:phosphoenolpyruvate carboxykinase (ATP)
MATTAPTRSPALGRHVRANLSTAELYEDAIRHGEGLIAADGPLVVRTGKHTGRSPEDKFIVDEPSSHDKIWWGTVNRPISEANYERLRARLVAYTASRDLYSQDCFIGAAEAHRRSLRVYTETAWASIFARNLFRRPTDEQRAGFTPNFTIICVPSFQADPETEGTRTGTAILVHLKRMEILIVGTEYAGEIKKSAFTVMNYLMPDEGVLPMHSAINIGQDGDPAVFFGLSGTGKTTLSADPRRSLIGDDEHGWGDGVTFNFEGGCYAKTIRLSAEAEPEIWNAVHSFGTVLENVTVDERGKLDLDDDSKTENTRAAYKLEQISNALAAKRAGHPKSVVFLTADAFGILPPIARLSPSQAMYHFLSGYTAKVAGTEKGVGSEPQATFSTCFGAPFMPRHPSVYGNLLRELIAKHKVDCWLVNTGWTGGKYGVGRRMPIKATRALLDAALSGKLKHQPMRTDPLFGFQVPIALPGVEPAILTPRETWADKAAYDAQARALVDMFNKNFAKFEVHVDADVKAAAPALRQAAE